MIRPVKPLPEDRRKKFGCHFCDKKFLSREAVTDHERSYHSKKLQKFRDRNRNPPAR